MKIYIFTLFLLINSCLFSLAPKNTTKEKYDMLFNVLGSEFYSSKSIHPFHPAWFIPYLKYCSIDEILEFCKKSRDFYSPATLSIPFMPYENELIQSRIPAMMNHKLSQTVNQSITIQISVCGLGNTDIRHETEVLWLFQEISSFLIKNSQQSLKKIQFIVNAYDIQVNLLNDYNSNVINILERAAKDAQLPIEFDFSVKPLYADLLNPFCRRIIADNKQDIFIWRNTHLLDEPNFFLEDMLEFISTMKKSLTPEGFLLVHETDYRGVEIDEVLCAV